MPRKNKEAIGKELGTFLRQYSKKAQKGKEPNDRSYDPTIERYIKRLKPEDLDVLINGDDDERLPTKISK
jgi:hypothetical protein